MNEARILLVEDNEADVDLIRYTFKQNKINNELIVIGDGEEAVEYLLKKGRYKDVLLPDIIILDINLPKKNGLEVLKEIKADEDARIVPVVILTTSSADRDILEAYKNYVNAYLVKPVEIEEFIKVISKMEEFMIRIIKKPKLER